MMTYDHNCIRQSNNAKSKLQNPRAPFGLDKYNKEMKISCLSSYLNVFEYLLKNLN